MNTAYYDVVFLLAGRQFHQSYLTSWTNTVTFLHNNNITFTWAALYNPIISDTRNLLLTHDFNAKEFKTGTLHQQTSQSLFNNSLMCQKVIMIDDDMVWTPQDIQKLIESPYDVTVGLYKLSTNAHVSVSVKNDKEFLLPEDLINYTEPFPVYTSGLGFVACTYDVLTQLVAPWFGLDIKLMDDSYTTRGEDFVFFNKLRGIGASVYADPTIKLGHMKYEMWEV